MAWLSGTLGLLNKIHSGDVSVYEHRCVAVRNRNATCTHCMDACISGALSLCNDELVVSPDQCVGCGTCATVCPTGALEAHNPNDAELHRAALDALRLNGGIAVVACHRIVDDAQTMLQAEKLVAVECLGRVEESLVMALAAAGAQGIRLVRANCESCDLKVGFDTVEKVRETSNELLRTWGQIARVEIVSKFPASVRHAQTGSYDKMRRTFFFQAKDEAQKVAAAIAGETLLGDKDVLPEELGYTKVQSDGTLPQFIPDRRDRLLDNLAALGEPLDELIATRLWGHVLIDPEKCSSCLMCATFCPTGALRKNEETDGIVVLDHFPGDCVLCHCCEDICPDGALGLYDEVFAPDVLSGTVEHNVLRGPRYDMASSKRARTMFRDLLKCDDIYDR